ncbi:MAG: hypothetical protein U0Z26_01580 [Anaerolineales bacterium]
MSDIIKCPVCGKDNFADQEVCLFCDSELHPKSDASTLTPGQAPTKKNTAELEPILPQWLRDARDQSRQTAGTESPQSEEQKKSSMPPEAHVSGMDLLAGLHSQSEDDGEEDTPDWLASITGANNKPKQTPTESSEVRWVELGNKNDFAQSTPDSKEEETPDWLASLQAQPPAENDELNTWFNQSQSPAETESPTWFQESDQKNDFSEFNKEPVSGNDETLDWLRQMDTDDRAKDTASELPSFGVPNNDNDMPTWMSQEETSSPLDSTGGELPAWLNTMGAEDKNQSEVPVASPEPTFGAGDAGISSNENETPDWLKSLESFAPAAETQSDEWTKLVEDNTPVAEPSTTPAWLKNDTGIQNETPAWLSSDSASPVEQTSPTDDAAFGDIPSWLKAAAPQSSIFSEPAAKPEEPSVSEGTDWLATFKSDTTGETQAPAFEGVSFNDGGDDALMNTLPDWLANASEPSAQSSSPTPITNTDAISPGELPSWVQAMRPVDPGASQPTRSFSSDQTLETKGALSGLQGVLPAAAGYAPSSKPKAYSIKLQSTEEQQAQALLLEQILSAEAEPEPIASYSPLIASRGLRWFIAFAVFAVVFLTVFLRTQIFSMPFQAVDTPNELQGALSVAQTVPDGGDVLVVVDYQPARAAELEAAVVPMLDQMDVLHHPRLVFVSTHETGSILADQLMKLDVMTGRFQNDAQKYINLGYLPGGSTGVRSFIQDPQQTVQYPAPFAQFGTVIVMTDNAESGRAWVEQLTAVKNTTPLVFITSAQASPMLQPYYASGQAKGIVSGLYGAAIFEQNNANRPGTSRIYWDAYSAGMLLAALLVIGGGFVSLILGIRDRALTGDGK